MTVEWWSERDPWDVLVVGAGPTGLAMAAQLRAHGSSVLLVDKNQDRAQESRALAVQPRTLEVLRPFGLAHELVRRGNPAATLLIHAGGRTARAKLFDIGVEDTEFPFLLFVSQAETEAVLGDYLDSIGVPVHRGTCLQGVTQADDGCTSTLRADDGRVFEVRTRYVVGCDGAHSTVRDLTGTGFLGGRYPQTFLLADLHVDGLDADTINAFITDRGPFFFFPLDRPAPWRIITIRANHHAMGEQMGSDTVATTPVSLAELQELADDATGGKVRLHNAVWATAFHLHHRYAERYRSGRMFLAGDAAHVHSPAGAQGMNTGIQDAINLGWKLALVSRELAAETLLDSYDAERRPVGEFVLRFTDRAFTAATSNAKLPRLVRRHVVPRMFPVALKFRTGRAMAFRTVSQLAIKYRPGPAIAASPRRIRHRKPRAGDRLPDAQVQLDGTNTRLHEVLGGPRFHLLVAGSREAWQEAGLADITGAYGDLVALRWLSRDSQPGVVYDGTGEAHRRIGVRGAEAFVIRPDGHIGCRCAAGNIDVVRRYMSHVLTAAMSSTA